MSYGEESDFLSFFNSYYFAC